MSTSLLPSPIIAPDKLATATGIVQATRSAFADDAKANELIDNPVKGASFIIAYCRVLNAYGEAQITGEKAVYTKSMLEAVRKVRKHNYDSQLFPAIRAALYLDASEARTVCLADAHVSAEGCHDVAVPNQISKASFAPLPAKGTEERKEVMHADKCLAALYDVRMAMRATKDLKVKMDLVRGANEKPRKSESEGAIGKLAGRIAKMSPAARTALLAALA